MKKVFLLASFTLIAFFSAKAQVDLKAGFAYAFDAEEGGLNIGGVYGVTDEIDVAAGLTFYFPGENFDYWMIDFDGHYNFNVATGLNLYPLAGLNFSTAKVEGFDGNTEFGLNIGGGANFRLVDNLSAFLELKYILGDADQGVLGLGLAYRIK